MDVKGCAAIVTGGGSGMGAETGRFLAAAGAKVALLDVNLDGAKQVAGEIGGLALECNVADAASAQAAIAKARETHGPARICINCAGIAPAKRIVGRDGPMPLEDFTRVIDVNLVGTFNIMRLAAADMQTLDPVTESDERGVIICTASIAAFEGQIGQAAYSASKGGVVSLTLQAAREFASNGIRVVTIVPGLIATPMLLSMPKEVQESLAQQPPFPKRFGRPDEYAKLAMHIIDNEMINGDCIRLDGAIRMQPK
ncbi:MAG: SDR family NAD(P)-dependent oxidoreductase [Gammaproteobacteria bacterium]|jgi:NAD(P)-dependent dehydrogenase (short-subunit alcohol dehydrogenase family)|nr:SDR family NAD(P)-dependent oxidoreductase [Gammaproteobacteria bacterium]